jgi:hypothetical protein
VDAEHGADVDVGPAELVAEDGGFGAPRWSSSMVRAYGSWALNRALRRPSRLEALTAPGWIRARAR